MALTGLQIYKQLPKTNCKECGFPTCLAFAMKLAAKQTSLDKCPQVTPEAKAALESASRPPIQLVTIGTGESRVQIGNETQLYRHEERFYRPTGVAIRVADDTDDGALAARAEEIGRLTFERVGQTLKVDLIAVENASGDPGRFAGAAKAASEKSGLPCVLMSAKAENLKAAGGPLRDTRPLLYISDPAEAPSAAAVAKELACPLGVRADGVEALAELTPKIAEAGVEELVLDPGTRSVKACVEAFTRIRRLSLKNFRPLGYPIMAFASAPDPHMQVIEASTYICKYAGVLVMGATERSRLLPVLTTRQNIYTDPQKPVAVEPKLNEVGEVTPESPVLVTTNFSLSYYSVEGEVDASRVPSYIIAVDTEGTSVLTAWASDKFNATTIAEAMKNSGVEEKVRHKKVVIPGLVAVLSGGLEDESGWSVIVGPKEASGIPGFLKNQWKP